MLHMYVSCYIRVSGPWPKERSVYTIHCRRLSQQEQHSSFGSIGSAGIDSRSQYLAPAEHKTGHIVQYVVHT